jgi:hypothetical protein
MTAEAHSKSLRDDAPAIAGGLGLQDPPLCRYPLQRQMVDCRRDLAQELDYFRLFAASPEHCLVEFHMAVELEAAQLLAAKQSEMLNKMSDPSIRQGSSAVPTRKVKAPSAGAADSTLKTRTPERSAREISTCLACRVMRRRLYRPTWCTLAVQKNRRGDGTCQRFIQVEG